MGRSAFAMAQTSASIFLLSVLTACAAVQTYPGAPRAENEIAILESGSRGKIVKIDGREYSGGSQFALLPGEHSLHFRVTLKMEDTENNVCPAGGCTGVFGQPLLRATEVCDAVLNAESGHRYRIVRSTKQGKKTHELRWTVTGYQTSVQVIDLATGEDAVTLGTCKWEKLKI